MCWCSTWFHLGNMRAPQPIARTGRGLFSQFVGPVKFEITDLVVSSEGTIGYSHSIQRLSGVDPKGAPVDMTVRVTDVYRKQGGDGWLIVHEHVSVPVDLATDKGDLASKP
jgi:ketosteroid isomerase-like protein